MYILSFHCDVGELNGSTFSGVSIGIVIHWNNQQCFGVLMAMQEF